MIGSFNFFPPSSLSKIEYTSLLLLPLDPSHDSIWIIKPRIHIQVEIYLPCELLLEIYVSNWLRRFSRLNVEFSRRLQSFSFLEIIQPWVFLSWYLVFKSNSLNWSFSIKCLHIWLIYKINSLDCLQVFIFFLLFSPGIEKSSFLLWTSIRFFISHFNSFHSYLGEVMLFIAFVFCFKSWP